MAKLKPGPARLNARNLEAAEGVLKHVEGSEPSPEVVERIGDWLADQDDPGAATVVLLLALGEADDLADALEIADETLSSL